MICWEYRELVNPTTAQLDKAGSTGLEAYAVVTSPNRIYFLKRQISVLANGVIPRKGDNYITSNYILGRLDEFSNNELDYIHKKIEELIEKRTGLPYKK